MAKDRPTPDRPKGPDKSAFYAAILLISIPIVLFFVFVCPHLVARLGVLVVIVPVYAVVFCLTSLFIASSVDPGVIPRSNAPPIEHGSEPKHTLVIHGRDVTVRWCATCRIVRPPRASHCPDCDRCVLNFDHHCPWVGNCIGKRNYRFFVMFLLSCTFLCAYVCGFSITRLVWLAKENPSFIDAVLESPISLILAIYSFFIFWSVGGLFAYHQYLTSIALTTHEEMKSTFSGKSPYSGGYILNFLAVWCPPCYPSYFPASYGSHAGGRLNNEDTRHTRTMDSSRKYDRDYDGEYDGEHDSEHGEHDRERNRGEDSGYNLNFNDYDPHFNDGKRSETLPLKYSREEV